MEINEHSRSFTIYDSRSSFINKVKQDNIQYRSLPDEKIDTAVYKVYNHFRLDENKLENFLQNKKQYNVSNYYLDIHV